MQKRIIAIVGAIVVSLIFTWDIFAQAPGVNWARGIGGPGGITGNDYGSSMAVDAAGNIYYTGVFDGTVDFNPGPGVFNLTCIGNWDVFISKLDNAGNFLWAKAFHGTGADWSGGITLDAAGFIYVTGDIAGTTDFDPGPSVFNIAVSGSNDVFVVKLDNSGNLIWAKLMNGFWSSLSNEVVVDPSTGAVYTAGGFEISVDFDPGSPIYWLSVAGGEDAFISKLDASGNFVWAKQFGGTWHEEIRSIALDATGNVYSTGHFQNTTDFDPGTGVFNLTAASTYDVFISKLNSSGNFVWAKKIGGPGMGMGSDAIALDNSGNMYISGIYSGTVDFDPGTGVYNLTANGWDCYILKLDGSGNFIWVKTFTGAGNEGSSSLKLDAAGNIYATGSFFGTADFDPGASVFNVTSVAGSTDLFVAKLNNTGNFNWVKTGGGTNIDGGSYLTLDALGHVHVIGIYLSPTFTIGTFNFVNNGSNTSDIFITQLDTSGQSGPLPVELVYFSAAANSDNQVEVKWTTNSEINNDYFIVQKSTNGYQFENCARINGAGNSSTITDYYFLDENPFQIPVSYYRLEQVDFDGTASHSKIVTVVMGKPDFELLNSFGDNSNQEINIIFTTGNTEKLNYQLYEPSGKIILQQSISPIKGINHISINAVNFASGIYYFSLSNGRDVLKTKIFY